MSEPVGADVESLCGKCGDTWHVVVAKMGDVIAKVQCKQCGGYHRHRPPGGAKPARRARTASSSASARAKASPPAMSAAPLVEVDPAQPPRRYSLRDSYEPGQRIEHPTFGVGVVEAVPEPGKMQVFFDGNRRILAQSKPGPKLEPPRHHFGGDE